MTRLAALVVLLGACGMWFDIPFQSTRIGEPDAVVVDAVWSAWSQRIGEPGPACEAQRRVLRVADLDGAEFRSACARCAGSVEPCDYDACRWGCAWGCYRDADGLRGSVQLELRTPILVASKHLPTPERRARLLVHEAVHWLGRCSGEGRDDIHVDARYWRDGVQGDAERALGLRGAQ